jgi:uncharacterized damage-inducible protein DinB
MTQKRPQTSEYAPYYANYISQVPDGDFLEILETQQRDLTRMLQPLSDKQAEFRYQPGKWSIKETLGHINDAERIFAYRILRIGRGDQTPLPGFEQNDYIQPGNFSARKLPGLLEEFASIRGASITLIRSLDDASLHRRGTASGKEVSVLAVAFVLAGHALHHQKILAERYLPALPPA